ncbi:MAG: flagellar basal body-associated FliL family protein [Lachnospiraceae bacterium]|nr:flagellar basal body-associated FliL family protein [Lachnospiraceae bacterium]
MKKNLLAILILALLIVNIVLTSIMMFSVTSASNKTAALVTDIASIIQLDVGTPATGGASAEPVPIEHTEVYDIADKMTIPLAKSSDGADHYALVSVSLSMNTKDEGYKSYGATIDTKASLIKSTIIEVIGTYTLEEAQADQSTMRQEILEKVQAMFDSSFIYDVSFSDIMFQ